MLESNLEDSLYSPVEAFPRNSHWIQSLKAREAVFHDITLGTTFTCEE